MPNTTTTVREFDNRNMTDQEVFYVARIEALEFKLRELEAALIEARRDNLRLKEQLMRRYE